MQTNHETELATRLLRLNTQVLTPFARYAHVALLLASAGMAVVLASLLATEPMLPLRTQMGFVAMLCVALAWIGYAAWVLGQRRPLFARHRVVAGRMAVGFNAAFVTVAATAFAMSGASLARNAVFAGVVMLTLAIVALVRANGEATRLLAMRRQLERDTDAAQI